jgi:predicted transcriptional regulator
MTDLPGADEHMHVALPPRLYEELLRLAGQSSRSSSRIAQEALKQYLHHERGANALYLSAP